jgi:hypothetical protein
MHMVGRRDVQIRRVSIVAGIVLGIALVLGFIVHDGIVVADPSLVGCDYPSEKHAACDTRRPIAISAPSGVVVRFMFNDVVLPVTKDETGTVRTPAAAEMFVAETIDRWPARRIKRTWGTPAMKDPVKGRVQDVEVAISADTISADIPITMPRDDIRTAAYLRGDLSLDEFVYDICPLKIDGTPLSAMSTTWKAFSMTEKTIDGKVHASADNARPAGPHGFEVDKYGNYGVSLNLGVTLAGSAFNRTAPFDRAPTSVTTNRRAQWIDLADPKTDRNADPVTVRLDPMPAGSLRQRAAQITKSLDSGIGRYAQMFAAAAAPIAVILTTLALLPLVRSRPRTVRSVFALLIVFIVMPLITLPQETLQWVRDTWHVGWGNQGAAGLAIRFSIYAMVTAVALAIAYLLAGRRFRPMLGTRPYVAIVIVFGTLFLAREQLVLSLMMGDAEEADALAVSLSPVASFIASAIVTIVFLAPRLFVRAALHRSQTAVWSGALVAFFVLCAAFVHRDLVVDRSHGEFPVPMSNAVSATIGAGEAASWLALPLVGLLLFVFARGLDARSPRTMSYAAIVATLALWCVGLNSTFLSVPVPALLAFVTIPLIALRPRRETEELCEQHLKDPPTQDELFLDAELQSDIAAARRTQRRLRDDFTGGTITRADYEAKNADLQSFIDEKASGDPVHAANSLRGSMFTSFPLAEPLRAARRAGVIGVVIGAVFLLLGFDQIRTILSETAVPGIKFVGLVGSTLVGSAVAAFAFVLLLPYFRGSMATTKGILLGIAALVATLPVTLMSPDPKRAVIDAASTLLFFPVVGAIFDVSALAHYANRMSLPRLLSFAGLGSFATVGTVFATAIVTALTGQLKDVTGQLVKSAIPISGSIQPGSAAAPGSAASPASMPK